jgi:glycosyltransferase involved in cell wall biosynthesis
MTATVIIPTTGSSELKQAIESVLNQSYPTTCYLVIDGEKFSEQTNKIILDNNFNSNDRLKICTLPLNVGANGFYGHRVYASFTHLINTDYVLYLDQDNWFDHDHVESCVKKILDNDLQWCYSLRKVCSKSGEFITNDDCESLGKWQTYHGVNHIDTNCYCIKTNVAIRLASAWHGGWGQDRVFLATIAKHFSKWDCTNKYSVNYRVDGGKGSVNAEFFINGNKIMQQKFNGSYPWAQKL